jgi:hypothetical protein
VIGFRLVDGLVAVSCKQSVIQQQVRHKHLFVWVEVEFRVDC